MKSKCNVFCDRISFYVSDTDLFYVYSAGDKLIGQFECYWLGLNTGILKARAVRYLLVKHKEGGMCMTITPSPECRRQPMHTARMSGPSAGII